MVDANGAGGVCPFTFVALTNNIIIIRVVLINNTFIVVVQINNCWMITDIYKQDDAAYAAVADANEEGGIVKCSRDIGASTTKLQTQHQTPAACTPNFNLNP